MEGILFIALICFYATVYFVTKFVTRRITKLDAYALKPRIIALSAVISSSIVLAIWARFNLINEALLATLPPFESGEYVGYVVGAFISPAFFAVLVIVFRLWRTNRHNKARILEEKRRNRSSPKW